MKRLNYRQLKPELLSAAALNFSAAEDSSARQEMLGSHLSQALVIDGATTRRCLTGMERRFGTATFNVKFPLNAEVKGVVEKYPRTEGVDAIRLNPLTTIIYESLERGIIDILDIPYFHCKHNHFGFRYKQGPMCDQLVSGAMIPQGTILADSPNLDNSGNYRLGTELNTVFMSVPGIIEDGVIVSESAIAKLTATGYEKRAGSWGRKRYPLNLYPGPKGEYKPHPDIGETVRDDGLLFAFREYNELLGGIEMAEDQLRAVDYVFDRRVYAVPGAKIVDVIVRKGAPGTGPKTPMGMDVQASRYHDRQAQYYDELNRITENTKRRGSSQIAPKLHHRLVEGMIFKNDIGKTKPRQMYNLQELDEWRCDITFEYKMIPNVGSKATDLHGGM